MGRPSSVRPEEECLVLEEDALQNWTVDLHVPIISKFGRSSARRLLPFLMRFGHSFRFSVSASRIKQCVPKFFSPPSDILPYQFFDDDHITVILDCTSSTALTEVCLSTLDPLLPLGSIASFARTHEHFQIAIYDSKRSTCMNCTVICFPVMAADCNRRIFPRGCGCLPAG